MGYHTLLLTQGVRELSHIHFGFAEYFQYGKPGWVSQCGEKAVAEIGQSFLHKFTP